MKYLTKKVGNHWQAWKMSGRCIVKRGHKRLCRIDAFMDAKEMERVEMVFRKNIGNYKGVYFSNKKREGQ